VSSKLALALITTLLLAHPAHAQPPQGTGVPAVVAKVRAGDIIVAVAAHPVKSLGELRVAIGQHKIGETVDLAVRRAKTSVTLKVTLAEMR